MRSSLRGPRESHAGGRRGPLSWDLVATTDRAARLERIFRLQHEFLESALSDAREILAIVDREGGVLAEADALRLRKLAHDLKGTGAVFGFSALSETAARLESLSGVQEPAVALRRCVDDLFAAVDEAKTGLKVLPQGV
jgi:HPt (histidine-containing phosphotransfer) domain-containing protein